MSESPGQRQLSSVIWTRLPTTTHLVTDERCLLVTNQTGNRESLELALRDLSENLGIADDLGQTSLVHLEEIKAILAPIQRLQVHEHGSRSIGAIGQMDTPIEPTSHVPQDPRIDRPKVEITGIVCVLDGGDVV